MTGGDKEKMKSPIVNGAAGAGAGLSASPHPHLILTPIPIILISSAPPHPIRTFLPHPHPHPHPQLNPVTGAVSVILTMPQDVIKTRMQGEEGRVFPLFLRFSIGK